MATKCTKCGEALIGSKKFCASCGTPAPDFRATLESHAPPAAGLRPAAAAPVSVAPPTRASSPGGLPQPSQAQPVSSASSGYGPPPPMPANAGYAPYAAPAAPPGAPPAGPAPYAPPPPPAALGPGFAPGTRVLVQWADGNRYPGFVQQIAPGYCLIGFPDGQQRWVEPRYLTVG